MAQFVVLAFKEKGLDAVPHLIYSGTNGDEALAAVAKLKRGEWDDVREYRNLRQMGYRMRVPETAPAPAPTPVKSETISQSIKSKK